MTYQFNVVGRDKANVDIVTSVLVKRQESEDECETLWVPVSANVKVDAATSSSRVRKKSRASGGSSSSLSSTQDQMEFGKKSPHPLNTAMKNLKHATSEAAHKLTLDPAVSIQTVASKLTHPALERSASHELSTRSQHHRQFSGPISLEVTHGSNPQGVGNSPGMLPVSQSHIYSTASSSTATSMSSMVARSTGSSLDSLLDDQTSPPASLPSPVRSTDREKLKDTSIRFEHKGQWYVSNLDTEEFTRRKGRADQYEKYFASRLQECVKPPKKNALGQIRPEVLRLTQQLNKLSDNYPRPKLFADAKVATLRGKVQMSMAGTGASVAQFSDADVKKQMAGRAFNEAEAKYAHQYRKQVLPCLNDVAAYSQSTAEKMRVPASASKLKPNQITALSAYLVAIDESSKNLKTLANEIDDINTMRPQTEEEYRVFLKALEDVKARTNAETDKIRWRSKFASKYQGSLAGVEAKDFSGQEKPLMSELLEAINLDKTKDQKLTQYLDIKKQELLMAKQLCTFKTLEALMESKPRDHDLAEALHYDECTSLIHGTDEATCEEIGASKLLDADPEYVDTSSLFDTLSLRLVTVKPVDDVVSLARSPELDPVAPQQKHQELQREITNMLTDDLVLSAGQLEYLCETTQVDFYECLAKGGEHVNISALADALNQLLLSSEEGYDDVRKALDIIFVEKIPGSIRAAPVFRSRRYIITTHGCLTNMSPPEKYRWRQTEFNKLFSIPE